MKNLFNLITILATIVIISGCGHSITHTDRGTGLIARIPLPDGSSLIDLKVGKIDSTTTVLRGGAHYDSVASTGGSVFGTAGTSDRIQISTIPQLNEGYMAEVLQSQNLSDDVKKALVASYMAKAKTSSPLPSKSISIGSAVATGKDSGDVKPEATGVDNAVNKVTETLPKVVPPIANATTKIVDKVADTSGQAIKDVSDVGIKAISATQKMVIMVALLALILIPIVIYIYIKYFRKSSVTSKITETVIDKIADVVKTVESKKEVVAETANLETKQDAVPTTTEDKSENQKS